MIGMNDAMSRAGQLGILVAFSLLLLVLSVTTASAEIEHSSVIVDAQVEMACFPPPALPGEERGEPLPLPCTLPIGVEERFVSPDASGSLRLRVFENGTARAEIRLEGLAPDLVISAWIAYFFPPGPSPDPIFEPMAAGLSPVAAVSAPLAATTARFSEGLGRDPNRFFNLPGGRARLAARLDYNPLLSGQGPLRNAMVATDQSPALPGTGAEQGACCPNGIPTPKPQAVGSSLLRVFDPETGFQNLGADGHPELLRSPVPVSLIAVVVHIDEMTHGLNPGIPIFPVPGTSVTTGDHFLLGAFDLRNLRLD